MDNTQGTRMFYPEVSKAYEKWSRTAGDNPIIMADVGFETYLAGWQAAYAGDASTRKDEGSTGAPAATSASAVSASPASLGRRLKTAIGGLRSIAYGKTQTRPNADPREVAKQALKDCGGEKGAAGGSATIAPAEPGMFSKGSDWPGEDGVYHRPAAQPETSPAPSPAPAGDVRGYRRFFSDMWSAYCAREFNDLDDAASILDAAVKHGLVEQVAFDAEKHAHLVEFQEDFEQGDPVYFPVATPATVATPAPYTMPDGRPIFGEGSPHDVGEHLATVASPAPDEAYRVVKEALEEADTVLAKYWFSSNEEDEWNNDDVIACNERVKEAITALPTLQPPAVQPKAGMEQSERHPWFRFLSARADAIHYYHAQGESDADIAQTLNLRDAAHVERIRVATAPTSDTESDDA